MRARCAPIKFIAAPRQARTLQLMLYILRWLTRRHPGQRNNEGRLRRDPQSDDAYAGSCSMGVGDERPVPVDQAGRIAFRGHAQRDDLSWPRRMKPDGRVRSLFASVIAIACVTLMDDAIREAERPINCVSPERARPMSPRRSADEGPGQTPTRTTADGAKRPAYVTDD